MERGAICLKFIPLIFNSSISPFRFTVERFVACLSFPTELKACLLIVPSFPSTFPLFGCSFSVMCHLLLTLIPCNLTVNLLVFPFSVFRFYFNPALLCHALFQAFCSVSVQLTHRAKDRAKVLFGRWATWTDWLLNSFGSSSTTILPLPETTWWNWWRLMRTTINWARTTTTTTTAPCRRWWKSIPRFTSAPSTREDKPSLLLRQSFVSRLKSTCRRRTLLKRRNGAAFFAWPTSLRPSCWSTTFLPFIFLITTRSRREPSWCRKIAFFVVSNCFPFILTKFGISSNSLVTSSKRFSSSACRDCLKFSDYASLFEVRFEVCVFLRNFHKGTSKYDKRLE